MWYNYKTKESEGGDIVKMKKSKLFWKLGVSPKQISCIPFSDNEEYYSFLRDQYNAGYRQIIVSSEAMIEIIKDAVINNKYSVYQIEFAEDDEELQEEIESILTAVETNPAYFALLLEKLQFLAEKSSIDIQRIKIKGRNVVGKAVDFYIQSNGLIGINEEVFDDILQKESTLIERCLFG